MCLLATKSPIFNGVMFKAVLSTMSAPNQLLAAATARGPILGILPLIYKNVLWDIACTCKTCIV